MKLVLSGSQLAMAFGNLHAIIRLNEHKRLCRFRQSLLCYLTYYIWNLVTEACSCRASFARASLDIAISSMEANCSSVAAETL